MLNDCYLIIASEGEQSRTLGLLDLKNLDFWTFVSGPGGPEPEIVLLDLDFWTPGAQKSGLLDLWSPGIWTSGLSGLGPRLGRLRDFLLDLDFGLDPKVQVQLQEKVQLGQKSSQLGFPPL